MEPGSVAIRSQLIHPFVSGFQEQLSASGLDHRQGGLSRELFRIVRGQPDDLLLPSDLNSLI